MLSISLTLVIKCAFNEVSKALITCKMLICCSFSRLIFYTINRNHCSSLLVECTSNKVYTKHKAECTTISLKWFQEGGIFFCAMKASFNAWNHETGALSSTNKLRINTSEPSQPQKTFWKNPFKLKARTDVNPPVLELNKVVKTFPVKDKNIKLMVEKVLSKESLAKTSISFACEG